MEVQVTINSQQASSDLTGLMGLNKQLEGIKIADGGFFLLRLLLLIDCSRAGRSDAAIRRAQVLCGASGCVDLLT